MKSDLAVLREAMVVFDTLAALPAEQQRDHALLQTLDGEARALVEGMLASLAMDGTDWLDRPVWSHLPADMVEQLGSAEERVDLAGRRFGNWRALEEIGHGGMSVVWRGQRADGLFEREVAIKLLKTRPGRPLQTEHLLQEVRILARLQHPHIAGLLDGGMDESLPWLVMELVDGVPITEYCRQYALDVDARISLFEQVVDAVAHAHARLVVHCDIKPSNVLVTADGQVKLVDFGIANLLKSSQENWRTGDGIYCTPSYAAPEQLSGDPASTAQDVFALGAVLYELLCGVRIRDMGMATSLMRGLPAGRSIVAPSARLRDGDGLGKAAATGIEADLESVVMRALAESPEQRYDSASLMVEDLRRWRRQQPVSAYDGGSWYRMGKWMRRHRLPAALAGMAILALVAGTVVSLHQASRASAEAELARSVQDFMLEMFAEVDPWRNQQRAVTVNEVMDTAIARLPERLEPHPAQRAEISDHLGLILQRLGRHDEAMTLQLDAAATWQRLSRQDLDHRARTQAARSAISGYRLEEAIALLDELIASSSWPPTDESAVLARILRAEMMTRSGEHDAQEALVSSVLDELDRIAGWGDQYLLGEIYLVAAESAENRADYNQAIARAEQARTHFQAVHGDQHPSVGKAMSYIATSRYLQGRYSEALEAMDHALGIDRTFLGDDHPQTLWSRYTQARILVDYGQHAQAGEALESIAATLIDQYGPDDPRLSMTYGNLAKVHRAMGQLETAAEWYDRGLPIISAQESEHPKFGVYQVQYALVLVELGQLEQADRLLQAGLALLQDKLGDAHPETSVARVYEASYLLARGREEAALATATEALDRLEAGLDAGSHQLGLAHRVLGDALAAAGRLPDAELHWHKALAILDRHEHRGQARFELDQLMAQLDTTSGTTGD